MDFFLRIRLKKILSYILPLTKRIESKINGQLEITWLDGKKVLDSENANYSYGALQRLLNYGLSQIYFDQKASILILGMGGGSVIKSFREKFIHSGPITAVEIDPVVIDIAQSEFDIQEGDDLTIVQEDALNYVASCKETFHLVIVDLFIDQKVPSSFYTLAFWESLVKLTKPKGTILFNAGIHLQDDTAIQKIITSFSDIIEFTKHDQVYGTNMLVIGRKK